MEALSSKSSFACKNFCIFKAFSGTGLVKIYKNKVHFKKV